MEEAAVGSKEVAVATEAETGIPEEEEGTAGIGEGRQIGIEEDRRIVVGLQITTDTTTVTWRTTMT